MTLWRSVTGMAVLCQLVAYLAFAAHVLSILRGPCASASAGDTENSGILARKDSPPQPLRASGDESSEAAAAAAAAAAAPLLRRGPDKLILLRDWDRVGSSLEACDRSEFRDAMPIAFVREFYVSNGDASDAAASPDMAGREGSVEMTTTLDRRTEELMRSNFITVSNNPCGTFVYVVEDERHVPPLLTLHEKTGARMRIYWSPGGTSFDRIFLAARLTADPDGGLFLSSTADVALPPLESLGRACARGLRRRDRPVLFVASRRDVFLDETDDCQIYNRDGRCVFPRIKTCEEYRDKYGSWDIFFGRTSLITGPVLERTWYSPSYWGAENVAAKVLAGSAADIYNLCPYVDVLHFHNVPRKGGRSRLFIRGLDGKAANAIIHAEGDILSVCDIDALSKLEHFENEYRWS